MGEPTGQKGSERTELAAGTELCQLSQAEFDQVVLPRLFHIVDRGSIQAQSMHLRYFRWSLVLLVLAASPALIQALSAHFIDPAQTVILENVSRISALLAAIFFAGTLIANFMIRLRQHDRDWYQGRALAESLKSIAWKFIMGAEPYPRDNDSESERRFLADFQEILSAAPKLSARAGLDEVHSPRITPSMQAIRKDDFPRRQEMYAKFRIDEEWRWYSGKAQQHAAAEQGMFHAVIACQFAALFLAMIRIAWPRTPLHFGPILAALAAAFLAWSQLRRFGELATAYSLAARDLGFISAQSKFVHNDADLARYVADAENAISREHTMWMARREVSTPARPAHPHR